VPRYVGKRVSWKFASPYVVWKLTNNINCDVRHKGRGLFACQDICKWQFIAEYSGELIDGRIGEDRELTTVFCFSIFLS
jgi:hypothetical protein